MSPTRYNWHQNRSQHDINLQHSDMNINVHDIEINIKNFDTELLQKPCPILNSFSLLRRTASRTVQALYKDGCQQIKRKATAENQMNETQSARHQLQLPSFHFSPIQCKANPWRDMESEPRAFQLFSLTTVSIQEPKIPQKYSSYDMGHLHKDLQLPSLASRAPIHLRAFPCSSWSM